MFQVKHCARITIKYTERKIQPKRVAIINVSLDARVLNGMASCDQTKKKRNTHTQLSVESSHGDWMAGPIMLSLSRHLTPINYTHKHRVQCLFLRIGRRSRDSGVDESSDQKTRTEFQKTKKHWEQKYSNYTRIVERWKGHRKWLNVVWVPHRSPAMWFWLRFWDFGFHYCSCCSLTIDSK